MEPISELPEYCRAATLDDLRKLIHALNDQQAPYLLIGGYALFVHGYHRATDDIDILVPATVEAGLRVKQALLTLPDKAAADIDPEWFPEGENIRVVDAFVVDIMLNACGQSYEKLFPYATTLSLGDTSIRTVSLEGLLLTKQTVRAKDIADRHVLQQAIAHST